MCPVKDGDAQAAERQQDALFRFDSSGTLCPQAERLTRSQGSVGTLMKGQKRGGRGGWQGGRQGYKSGSQGGKTGNQGGRDSNQGGLKKYNVKNKGKDKR